MISLYISLALKFFFLFTSFFALSMFLAMTAEKGPRSRPHWARSGASCSWARGSSGISILMRLTALILAALSALMVMTGVVNFMRT